MFTNKKQKRINNLVFGIVLSLSAIMIPSSIAYAVVVITPVIGNNNNDGFNDDGTYTNNSDIQTITQPQSHDSKSHDIVCQNMASILKTERSESITAKIQSDTLNDYISECGSYNE